MDVKGKQALPKPVDPALLNDPKKGQFKIISMTMRDASEGSANKGVFWSKNDWDLTVQGEQKVSFPA